MAYSKEYHRSYYLKNRAKALGDAKAYREKNLARVRSGKLQASYGISLSDYERMSRQQNGVCAICRRPEQSVRLGKRRILAVDHDHKTEAVRALLCHKCNSVLGYMDDDPMRLRAAADYLEKHGV